MIADLWQDLRYGARMLLKQKGLTAIAVLSLALGIGVTAVSLTLAALVACLIQARRAARVDPMVALRYN